MRTQIASAEKIMRLQPDEFIRRFLLHTMPDGFHRIRYFGFMANGHRAKNIALCRALLVDEESKPENASSSPDPVDKDAVDGNRPLRLRRTHADLLRTMRDMATWFCDAYASWQKKRRR